MIFNKERLSSNFYSYRNVLLNYYRMYHISVEPRSCPHDTPVSIRATGLKPNENGTISLTMMNDKSEGYFSYAYYKADSCGCIDLAHQMSVGGTYKGCLPMGLFSTLQHVQIEKRYQMLIKRNMEVPMKINVNLMRGFMGREKCARGLESDYETSTLHERYFMPKGGVRIPVKEGRIRGTLFLPPGKGPFNGVIDLYGTNGGLKEARAAQLSSNGIATLALAYFRYDDLPEDVTEIDLEYFEEACQYLLGHDKISSNGVGVIGSSLGSELALAMGIYLKNIKAIVAISGVPAVTFWPLKYKHIYIPAIEPNVSKMQSGDGMVISKDMIEDVSNRPECALPVEKIDANVLFLVGKDDQNWYASRETHKATERFRQHNRSNYEVVEYDGTGHMLEPPFAQFCDRIYHIIPKAYLFVGGKLNEHSMAEPVAWSKTINFLKSNLNR